MKPVYFLHLPLFFTRVCLFFLLSLFSLQAGAVDLNQATVTDLQQIKGIGPKTAERIIAERSRAGDFDSLQDLSDRVKGIGPKRLIDLEASGLKAGKPLPLKPTEKSTKNSPK